MLIILVVYPNVLPSIPCPASYIKHISGLHGYTPAKQQKQELLLRIIDRNHRHLEKVAHVARRFRYIFALIPLPKRKIALLSKVCTALLNVLHHLAEWS